MRIQHIPFSLILQSMAQISCFLSLSPAWHLLHGAGSRADARASSVATGQQLCPLSPPPRVRQPGTTRGYASSMLTQTHSLKAQTLLVAGYWLLVKGSDHSPMP